MGFQGSLDTVGLPDIFQLFSFGRKSGALHLTRGHERGVVYFVEGDVYYATVVPTDGIGNLLVRADLVSPEQWKQVLAQSKGDDGHQGEILLGFDDIDSVALEVFVRERIEDAIFKLAQWTEGDFGLEDEVHPFGPVFRFAVDPLLQVAEQRLEEWSAIAHVVPSVGMGVQVVRDLPADMAEVTLTRDEWRLLAGVAPGHSIDDIASGLGETEFRVCRVLAGMVERGIVELVSEEKLNALRSLLQVEPPEPEASHRVEVASPSGADAEPGPEEIEPADPAETLAPEPEPADRKLSIAELAAQAEAGAVPPAVPGHVPPLVEPSPDPVGTAPAYETEPATGLHYDPAAVLDQQIAVPHPGHYSDAAAHGTGEFPAVEAVPPPLPQPPVHNDFPSGDLPVVAEPSGAPSEPGLDAMADSELDKSLILRLIAGVKSL